MRTTYLVEIRQAPPTIGGPAAPERSWQPQTRCKTRREAEAVVRAWRDRGLEARLVVEK